MFLLYFLAVGRFWVAILNKNQIFHSKNVFDHISGKTIISISNNEKILSHSFVSTAVTKMFRIGIWGRSNFVKLQIKVREIGRCRCRKMFQGNDTMEIFQSVKL